MWLDLHPLGGRRGLSSVGFLVRPLRGRREREIQGITCPPGRVPLKPRQGPCPWTPLLKNLYLKGRQGTMKVANTHQSNEKPSDICRGEGGEG